MKYSINVSRGYSSIGLNQHFQPMVLHKLTKNSDPPLGTTKLLVKLHYVHEGQGWGNLSNLSAKSYSPSPYGFSLGPDTLDSCSCSLHTARCCWCLCGKGGKTSAIFTMYYLYSYYNLKTHKRKDERTPSHWPIHKVQRLRVTKRGNKEQKDSINNPINNIFYYLKKLPLLQAMLPSHE